MNLTADFFTLFQLAPRFRLDLAELEARYLALQGEAHPDRFARADERAQRFSIQIAARINEGRQILKVPLTRAKYLLHLAGHDLEAERNVCMEPEFLAAQMEWREALEAARSGGDRQALERLGQRLKLELQGRYQTLGALLDDRRDLLSAAGCIRQLMFLEKLRSDIDDALALLEDECQGTEDTPNGLSSA
ncbi:MAG: Fe-S protein assembly co-chaperone HscB [Zoogloeaceae bacterium]|jgi:molecular chaperone HscB|nr:Fe-S protein assembly co-chaperone HscB [Zoogloeaceae bacterium]